MKIAVLKIYWDADSDVDIYTCKNGTLANKLLLQLCQERWDEDYASAVEDMDHEKPVSLKDLPAYMDANPNISAEINIQPLIQTIRRPKK